MNLTNAEYQAYLARREAKVPELEVGSGGIQDQIEQFLRGLGHACYYIRSRTDKATTNKVGTPDFVGWYDKKPFAMEVKQKGRKLTIEQQGELLRAKLAGAKTAVVYSLGDAMAVMDGLHEHNTTDHQGSDR